MRAARRAEAALPAAVLVALAGLAAAGGPGAPGASPAGVPGTTAAIAAAPQAAAGEGAATTAGAAAAAGEQAAPASVAVLIRDQVFELELALTPEARERGLMGRADLPPERGMLFVFPDEAPRRFWMKHTRVDLDIVYLDGSGAVVSTATMHTEPPQGERETDTQYEDRLPLYPSGGPARCAIEFRAGTLAALRLTPGDRLDLGLERLAPLAR